MYSQAFFPPFNIFKFLLIPKYRLNFNFNTFINTLYDHGTAGLKLNVVVMWGWDRKTCSMTHRPPTRHQRPFCCIVKKDLGDGKHATHGAVQHGQCTQLPPKNTVTSVQLCRNSLILQRFELFTVSYSIIVRLKTYENKLHRKGSQIIKGSQVEYWLLF